MIGTTTQANKTNEWLSTYIVYNKDMIMQHILSFVFDESNTFATEIKQIYD